MSPRDFEFTDRHTESRSNEVHVLLCSILVRTIVYPGDTHYICRPKGNRSPNNIPGKYAEEKKKIKSVESLKLRNKIISLVHEALKTPYRTGR